MGARSNTVGEANGGLLVCRRSYQFQRLANTRVGDQDLDEIGRAVGRPHIFLPARGRSRHGIGYSTGLNYPPDWGEHTASLRPGDKTVMQENMTFHCIPGVWADDWGIEISECFRVGPNGAEPFYTTARELFVKN